MPSLTAPTTSVKEIPLLFTKENRSLVRQRLKWETRRGMKIPDWTADVKPWTGGAQAFNNTGRGMNFVSSPYGMPQNHWEGSVRYWMREPVQVLGFPDSPICDIAAEVLYLDTNTRRVVEMTNDDHDKLMARKDWRKPSTALFMLKSFTRTWLKGVRVWTEQLGAISEESAVAEGIQRFSYHPRSSMLAIDVIEYGLENHPSLRGVSPIDAYRLIWESINGSGSWGPDKWVWCIQFELMEGES
ncbi:MAG: hypothetical protein AAGD09_03650 [Cyanobacteria bacterium P01_F01_bin.56]